MIRLSRFTVVSAIGIGVQLAVLALLTEAAHVGYLAATPIAIAAAVAHNFSWHHRWTWADRADRRPWAIRFARFALTNGLVSLAGNVALMVPLVEWTHLAPVFANVLAIGACGLVNFWVADRIVFVRSSVTGGRPPCVISRMP